MPATIEDDKCLAEFVELALKHRPTAVVAATVMVQAMSISFLHDTVTEAIDTSRKMAVAAEATIRAVFPKVTDIKLRKEAEG